MQIFQIDDCRLKGRTSSKSFWIFHVVIAPRILCKKFPRSLIKSFFFRRRSSLPVMFAGDVAIRTFNETKVANECCPRWDFEKLKLLSTFFHHFFPASLRDAVEKTERRNIFINFKLKLNIQVKINTCAVLLHNVLHIYVSLIVHQ